VFNNFWKPLLNSINSSSSSSIAQQQQQQPAAARAAAAAAATAAALNASLAAAQPPAAAAAAAVTCNGTGEQQSGRPSSSSHQQQQQQQLGVTRQPRCALTPIQEGLDTPFQQQQQQETEDEERQPLLPLLPQQQQQQGEGPCDFQLSSPKSGGADFESPFAFVAAATADDDSACPECTADTPPAAAAAAAATNCGTAAAATAGQAGRGAGGVLSPTGFSSKASSLNPVPGMLRSAPSWLVSARKLLQQQDQQLAARRLVRAGGGSSGSNGGVQVAQQRHVVVAGEERGRWELGTAAAVCSAVKWHNGSSCMFPDRTQNDTSGSANLEAAISLCPLFLPLPRQPPPTLLQSLDCSLSQHTPLTLTNTPSHSPHTHTLSSAVSPPPRPQGSVRVSVLVTCCPTSLTSPPLAAEWCLQWAPLMSRPLSLITRARWRRTRRGRGDGPYCTRYTTGRV